MIYRGKKIDLIDGNYRPDRLVIDGKEFSMSRHADAHGFNWKSAAKGNVLFYQSEDGDVFEVEQKVLMNTFAPALYDLYKQSGLSQREFAEKLSVPKRTLEDWLTFRRIPSNYVQDGILDRAKSL